MLLEIEIKHGGFKNVAPIKNKNSLFEFLRYLPRRSFNLQVYIKLHKGNFFRKWF